MQRAHSFGRPFLLCVRGEGGDCDNFNSSESKWVPEGLDVSSFALVRVCTHVMIVDVVVVVHDVVVDVVVVIVVVTVGVTVVEEEGPVRKAS